MADIQALLSQIGMAPTQINQAPPDLPQDNPLASIGIGAPPQANLGPAPLSPQQTQEAKWAQQEAELEAARQKAMAVLQADPKSMIPQNIADFKKYEDAQFKEKYGKPGIGGTAHRFLQEVLAGYSGKTLQEVNSEAARKDWTEAMQEQAQQIAQQQHQAAQVAQLTQQQLADLRAQRSNDVANRRIDVNSPDNKAAVSQAVIGNTIQHLKDTGVWDTLSGAQQASIQAGTKSVTPDRAQNVPGSAKGADILQFHTDAKSGGQPLDPTKYYRLVKIGDKSEYEPTTPPGYEVPQTTTRESLGTVGGNSVVVPLKSTRGPAGQPQSTNTGGGGGIRVLGPSGAEQRRLEEPTYTAKGQEVLQETQPVIDMMSRVKDMIEPVKDQNVPFSTLVDRGAYSLGIATDASSLINKLELERIVGAARILKGSSRAISVLEDAKVHLPNPKVDSAKLMYEKTQTILQALDDIKKSVDTYERKYPGMSATKPDDIKNKPKVWNPKTGKFD